MSTEGILRLRLASSELTTVRPAFVMGIVNCTPDSFFAGSRGAAERVLRLVEEGADIIDLGGESTRPGSGYVSEKEELSRIIPVIREVRRRTSVPISVDTRKAAVMEAALSEGADLLNDVSALEDDGRMAQVAARSGIPVILMHKRGRPADMQRDTAYTDVVAEVDAYLTVRARFAEEQGIAPEKIIVDPGIGFGKDAAANRLLMRRCGSLCGGRYPVLMALSRKSCIGEMTGRPVEGRLAGTLAADLLSVLWGATLVRVHDVAACVDTLAVLGAFRADGLLPQAPGGEPPVCEGGSHDGR